MKCALTKFAARATVIAIFLTSGDAALAQDKSSSTVRMFRLEGTFGSELAVAITPPLTSENAGFILQSAKLEADSMGFLTRFWSRLTITNTDSSRRISQVEWRMDIYDSALRSHSQDILQSDKVKIYPGETMTASANFGAVLPDKMVILLQLVRVSFADGSYWTPAAECTLGEDLRSVSCKPR